MLPNCHQCFHFLGLSFPYMCNDGVGILLAITPLTFYDFCLKNLDALSPSIRGPVYCEYRKIIGHLRQNPV